MLDKRLYYLSLLECRLTVPGSHFKAPPVAVVGLVLMRRVFNPKDEKSLMFIISCVTALSTCLRTSWTQRGDLQVNTYSQRPNQPVLSLFKMKGIICSGLWRVVWRKWEGKPLVQYHRKIRLINTSKMYYHFLFCIHNLTSVFIVTTRDNTYAALVLLLLLSTLCPYVIVKTNACLVPN